MKLGVISDTHDRLGPAFKGIEILRKNGVGAIVHCGDWTTTETAEHLVEYCATYGLPIFGVYGNNDPELAGRDRKSTLMVSEDLVMEFPEGWVAVMHGDDRRLLEKTLDSNLFAAVFSGHTHVARKETVGKTLWVNPGTAGGRRRSGTYSVAVYDTGKKRARIIEYQDED